MRAHNDWLELLIEFGLPMGLGLMVAALGWLGFKARAVLRQSDIRRYWLGLGAFFAILAVLLHELVDYNLMVPANMIIVAFFAGVFFYDYSEPRRPASRSSRGAPGDGQFTATRSGKPLLQPVNTAPEKNPFHDA